MQFRVISTEFCYQVKLSTMNQQGGSRTKCSPCHGRGYCENISVYLAGKDETPILLKGQKRM
jgi:hypothetical protein